MLNTFFFFYQKNLSAKLNNNKRKEKKTDWKQELEVCEDGIKLDV
jgi:hypothetical protein